MISVSTLTRLAATGWIGTAAELLEALPAEQREGMSADGLGRLLRRDAAALLDAGVTLRTRRRAGTGARLLDLTLESSCRTEAGSDAADAGLPTTSEHAELALPDLNWIRREAGAEHDERQDHHVAAQAGPVGVACGVCRSVRWWSSDRMAWDCTTCSPAPLVALPMGNCSVCRGLVMSTRDGGERWRCAQCNGAPLAASNPDQAWATT